MTPTTRVEQPYRESVIQWLLDSDPAIRWQVMRDLTGESAATIARERARIATEGWGARLLALQAPDGHWSGATWGKSGWIFTSDTVSLLRELGLDPASAAARKAIGLVRDRCDWGSHWGNSPFFEGEVEPCINGRILACGAYFGAASERLVNLMLSQQLEDGGWNCYAPPSEKSSFHSTICVLEGLLAYEQAEGITAAVSNARHRAEEYLLERRLFRSLSTGAIINPGWLRFSFPTRWHYDVLRGLDYLRRAGVKPDDRIAEAIVLVRKKQADGRWLLEHTHAGAVHFEMEAEGEPSRWITLCALRVLDWYNARN